jgi:hypothetical protein
MELRELQHFMTDAGLSSEQVRQMKLIRKRMKNRISAKAHSQKQQVHIKDSDDANRILRENHGSLQLDYIRLMGVLTEVQKQKELFCAQTAQLTLQTQQLLTEREEQQRATQSLQDRCNDLLAQLNATTPITNGASLSL